MPHRDVKPHNILMGCDGIPKLADFGIVRWDDFDPIIVSAGTITRADVQLGSWYYMAPEQLAAPHAVGLSADIYGLGVTWLHLLLGDDTPPPPQAIAVKDYVRPCKDERVCTMIGRMVDYRPVNRPSLDEVIALASEVAG